MGGRHKRASLVNGSAFVSAARCLGMGHNWSGRAGEAKSMFERSSRKCVEKRNHCEVLEGLPVLSAQVRHESEG